LEEIKSRDGSVIAIVVNKQFHKDGINFLSKRHYSLQLGINSYKQGDIIKPHIHLNREITLMDLQEVIYIKNGETLVNLYDSNRELIKSIKLCTGDLIFFVSGGHGFEMSEDTVFIEVKQGPYLGKNKDKVILE
jgi:hypothetical protein